ncbi:MAG: TlpA family protein disulfide reductase [Flavobacteriales bacterium]
MTPPYNKKRIGILLALAATIGFLFWYFQRSELDQNDLPINLQISGQIKDAGGLQLFLEAPSDRGVIAVAQTEIDADGHFELPANIPGLGLYNLRLNDLNGTVLWLPLQANDRIKINCSRQNFGSKPGLSGVKWASSYQAMLNQTNQFEAFQKGLQANMANLDQALVEAKYDIAKQAYENFCAHLIQKDLDSPLNILLSMNLLPTTGFENWNAKHLATLEQLAQAYQKTFSGQTASQNMAAQYQQIEDAYFNYSSTINGSMPAPEIALPDPSGKTRSLSSLKGKYVLIDFWASWCGPCKSEMPNVVKLYQKYQNKNFTVLSVSLDEDANKWKEAISSWGMTWPNHVSDLKGWKSNLPQTYQFDGIPYTVLVNPDGNVIGTNLRGDKLVKKLAEIFK